MTAPARIVSVGAVVASTGGDDAALAAALTAAGIAVDSRVVVDDDDAAIERTLAPDGLTVVVAGAGGSAGDAARRAIARVAGVRLVLNDRMLAALEEAQRKQDRPLARRDERLALLPQGAVVWRLEDGETAWLLEREAASVVVVPRGAGGSATLGRHLAELAAAPGGRGAAVIRVLRTTGVSLADIEERLADFIGVEGRDVTVGTLDVDGEAWVRLRARGATRAAALAALAPVEVAVAARLGDDVYGRDGESLEQALARRLRERGLTVSVAESCTGGLLGHRLTGVPGSSAWFERGVIVYSNRAKEELLGVPATIFATEGAVSASCAASMVRGICRLSGSACGIAVTGIAGPDGGTPSKPVGTVFIAVAVDDEVTTQHFRFRGDRAAVKWQSSEMALDMLRRALGGASS